MQRFNWRNFPHYLFDARLLVAEITLADPATNPTSTSLLMSLCMHEDSVLFGGEVQVGQIIFVDSV
jgi:hypothetical protein